jgi:putative PIN family toxin of toxin-antitoxin system
MVRAVLDTNVFLLALINPHSRCGRLLGELAPRYELVLSPPIVGEILDVLHRPRLRAKFPQIAELDVTRIIQLFEQAEIVEPTATVAVSRDPKDDMFLACALTGGAAYLVTEDKDLLVLGTLETVRILRPHDFIAVLTPTA